MIPPSLPKGDELMTHTHFTCTLLQHVQHVSLQLPPAWRFMVFIYNSEDSLTTSVYCWCLLSGWTCLSVSLARWKHCLLFQRVNRTNQFNQCSSHSRYYADWKKHPNSNNSAGDWPSCLRVCSIYTCIVLVYDYQHASACINIHVNLWSRSFACGQISGTAAANSDLVPDWCLFIYFVLVSMSGLE